MSDTLVIDDTTYEIARLSRGPKEGEPYGLRIIGVGEDLTGAAFLTEDEARDLRDFINVHFGVAPKNAVEQRVREKVAQEILDNHRLYECHEEDPQSDNHPRACVWEIAQSAAEDVLGRELS